MANDYGDPHPTSKAIRLATLLNHFLHWASAIIVMSIAAYFLAHFRHNQHLIYWVTIAAIDSFLYLPALVLPLMKSYKGYLAPLAWLYSYLWLTAFIFAAQDYNWHNCAFNSPSDTSKCGLKKTLEAFAFIAFITNLIGQVLEWRLWDKQRFKPHAGGINDKTRVSGDTAVHPTTQPAAV
jgi:hypothetical protein